MMFRNRWWKHGLMDWWTDDGLMMDWWWTDDGLMMDDDDDDAGGGGGGDDDDDDDDEEEEEEEESWQWFPWHFWVRGSACPEHLGRTIPSVHALWILPSTAPWQHDCGTSNGQRSTVATLLRLQSSTCLWAWCLLDCLLEIRGDLSRTPPENLAGTPPKMVGIWFRCFFFSNGVTVRFQPWNFGPIPCWLRSYNNPTNDPRFVQAHERAQAGKCPNTIQATMGSLAMFGHNTCSHRLMDLFFQEYLR